MRAAAAAAAAAAYDKFYCTHGGGGGRGLNGGHEVIEAGERIGIFDARGALKLSSPRSLHVVAQKPLGGWLGGTAITWSCSIIMAGCFGGRAITWSCSSLMSRRDGGRQGWSCTTALALGLDMPGADENGGLPRHPAALATQALHVATPIGEAATNLAAANALA